MCADRLLRVYWKSTMNPNAILRSRSIAVPLSLFLAFSPPLLFPLGAFAQEKAIAPEKNPPGDIPDSQVFVVFHSRLGVSLKVPEGWARKEAAGGFSFADKYGEIAVSTRPGPPPTAASVRAADAPDMEKTGRAIKISTIVGVNLPVGPAVRVDYTENSEANAVTGKQIRLESARFFIGHGGDVATVTFSAPAGADNADQWKLMIDSFRW